MYLEDVNIDIRTVPEFVVHGEFIANIHGKFRNIGGAQIGRAQVTIIMSKCSDRPRIRAEFKQLFYPAEPTPKGSACTPNMPPILRSVRPLVPNDYAPFDFEFQAIHLE